MSQGPGWFAVYWMFLLTDQVGKTGYRHANVGCKGAISCPERFDQALTGQNALQHIKQGDHVQGQQTDITFLAS
jgi:hypothetical protein